MQTLMFSPMGLMFVSCILSTVSALSPPSAIAQATDTSPAGMVAFFPQSQCPTGWEPAPYAQGRLLLGATDLTTYDLAKTVGTPLTNLQAPVHQHAFTVPLDLAKKDLNNGDCGGSTCNCQHKSDGSHKYTVMGTTLNGGSSDLPLFQMLACEKKASGQSPPPTDGYGTSALAFFSLQSCPANWQPAVGYPQGYQVTWNGPQNYKVVITFDGTDSDKDGVLRGRGSDPSKIAGGKTNELDVWNMVVFQNNQKIATFSWNTQKSRSDFNFNYALASKEVYATVQFSEENGLNVGMPGTGNTDYNFFSNQAVGNLWLVHAGKTDSPVKGPLGNTQFTENTPTSTVDGYFVMPFEAPPDGTVGTLVGNPYGNGEQRSHSHALTSSINLDSYQFEKVLGSCSALTASGAHSFSGSTDTAFNNIPYTQLLLCEREPNFSTPNPPPVPSDIVTFYASQNCPYPWKSSATGTGRFLVGLPDGGTPNEGFGSGTPLTSPGTRIPHTHGLKGSVKLDDVQHVALAKGSNSPHFGTAGTYDYGGSTDPANFNVPYLTTANCQPCIGPNDANPVCHEQVQGKQ
ncbi:hypothetical protein ACTRXD_18905 [Nitrospira sp. T9]|uniref:hypothetical protein n=1 Tax=unclassified Nitrospira TaxID=2652172 RepID=UPI003F9D371D